MTDSLTQLGDSLVNIDVLSIHTEASDMLKSSYEAPFDCQDVEVSPTSGSSVILESVVSLENAEITSTPVGGSESEVCKIPSSDMLLEDSQTSPDEKHPADKPEVTGLEPTALFNQNRGDDSAFANVETESEVSVKQEDSDINFEENLSFSIEPQGKENYESEDNTSFDMVGSSSDVEIITESPTYSMDELNESEIAVVCEPVEIVPSDSPPNMSPSVEIGHPSKDAVQDSMPYAGPTATPRLLPADTDSNGDEVATGDVGAHADEGISGESQVVIDTDKDDDTLSALEEQTLSTESNSPEEVCETNLRHSESGTDKADEVISGPGPIPDTVSEAESEDVVSEIGLQSTIAIEQTQDMVEDHGVSGQMDDDIQQIVNQTDVFEVMVTNQSEVVEESSDPDVSDNVIPNKESDNLDDFFSSGSLVAQDNDVSLKPDFQADIVDDNLLPVQLCDKDEIPTTSFSNILTEDAVGETDTEKEIHTFETNAPIQGISPEPHQLPSDQFIDVNMSQQIPSDEDDGFTDLEGFNQIPVPDDLPSISDSEQFTSFTDPKSQSDISIETKENTTEVTSSSGITSNVIDDFGQQFIPGRDTLEERTSEQNDAPDVTSHVSEHDAPKENAEKEDQTDAELTDLIMADSLKTEDAVVESESVNFAENVINVNAPGSSCYLDADADHHDVDVPSQTVKPFDSDGAPTETKSESPELMSTQFEVDINLDTGHSDQVSSSEQGSWASDVSEAGSDQSINDFEDLGMTTPEQVEVSQTGDGSTVSTDSLLDGFVEISSSPVGGGIGETSEAEANLDSKFPESTEAGQDGETVDGTGEGFLVLSGSEEDKQAKLYNDGSNESNVGQGIIDFPDSSLTDSQESAAFLDLSSSQEGLVEDNDESGMSETSVVNRASTVREINIDTGREQAADSGVLSMSPPIASSQTEEIILKPFEDLSSDVNMQPRQDTMTDPAVSKAAPVIPQEDSASLSPTDNNMETNLPFNTLTPINNETIGTNGLISTTDPEADPVQIHSPVSIQNQMKGDLTSSNESSVLNIDDSDAVLPVMTKQTEDRDPFGLTSGENTVSSIEASDAFPSVETEQTADSDPFGLATPSGENTETDLGASDAFPSVMSGPTTDSDPFGLTSATVENIVPNLDASDALPSVETEQTADSDPFGLASPGENTDSNLVASDAFTSVEPVPTTDSDPFGLTSSESSVPNPVASDAFTSVERGPPTDSDPFGLPSSESSVPNPVASDAFTTVEPVPTTDSDPFGLTSSESSVPKLEASDAFPSIETEQTADSDPFGLASPSGENTLTDLGASDAFPSVEPVPTTDSDPFGLTSATVENIVPNLDASDALPSVETEQAADSDPFGLASPGENTDSNLVASDAFTSVEPVPTTDSDPFGLTSSESSVPNPVASDAFTTVEPVPTTDSDPFGLTSSENIVPKLEASDAFPSIETKQTADSDPFGLASPSGEKTDSNLVASHPFPLVEPVPTTDSDPFGLTSSESSVPNPVASDAFSFVEPGPPTDSDPFGLTSSENTVPNLEASDAFPSIETKQTADSDPFGLASSENSETNLGAQDMFPSIETGKTADSNPFVLATPSDKNTLTDLGASDSHPSVEPGKAVDSFPFGSASSQDDTVHSTSEQIFSAETSQVSDSDPFGLTNPSQNDTVPNLSASNTFPPLETAQMADSNPFGLISQVEPSRLETGDMFDVSPGSNVETGTSHQNPMTDSGMLLDFMQSGSEAPSRTNSGISADMFGSSPDFTSPSSTQDFEPISC
ncbi:mucin-5AC-like [Haliotis rubra]|uniref:mucin-5AC-like n=1 Tax=Haliotis rubra TaxID=36100 RepID=UPI001EE5EF57|nr:mucin-5AC-like [Haliotis rubra]